MSELWGWDRQLMWKFNADDTSAIVAEKCNEKITNPLKGLSLYEVDMPPNAKLDYLERTYARVVVDAADEGVDLVTDGAYIAAEDVSLKKSNLRRLHQCAVEQYGAWKSRATACFPVILQRRLWGIALHSSCNPVALPSFQERLAMEFLTQAFALR